MMTQLKEEGNPPFRDAVFDLPGASAAMQAEENGGRP